MYYRVDLERKEWIKLKNVLNEVSDSFKDDEEFSRILSLVLNRKIIASTHRKVNSINKARDKRSEETQNKILKTAKALEEKGIKITYSLLARESKCGRNSVKKYYTINIDSLKE